MMLRTSSRKRLVAAPVMAAMLTLGVPAAAHAAEGPGGDRVVGTLASAPQTQSYGGGTTRRAGGTVRSLDDIRSVVG